MFTYPGHCNNGSGTGARVRDQKLSQNNSIQILRKTGAYKVSSEESDMRASYSSSNQAVAFTRSESFQQAVANDIVSVASLPAENNPS